MQLPLDRLQMEQPSAFRTGCKFDSDVCSPLESNGRTFARGTQHRCQCHPAEPSLLPIPHEEAGRCQ
jgi:hypothetical protein